MYLYFQKFWISTDVMSSSTTTNIIQDTKEQDTHTTSNTTTLKLSLKKEKAKKIQWTEDTVDNEGGCVLPFY